MSTTFDQSKDEIAKLCHYFEVNRKSFLASGVKEAHVRQSLIDPFFETLGWDVRNSSRIAPQYREVVPEDSLDVEGHQKAPDYTFRVGTLPKFYAEAKKCGINISADPGPAYQLRRYAFSAKLALSILTDFEELGVYECSSRPRPSDKSSHSRIQYFHFEEYPDKWREIWDIFSREAVWSGSFDQYITSKRKRGTSEVDTEFLKDIESWRESLARNIALRNPQISVLDLNAAVQRTIDRIIFLRMAEDRGLEPYAQILKLCEQPDIYRRFISNLCRKADERYNSGLFHFHKEQGIADAPDTITPRLIIDDKTLKPIIQSLYFEFGSPYHFGVLPVEILGTVYERFLGKVIRLTAGHQAKVEEKPEVRKAGGVYYTPSYIVDYIVKNTVGKQVEGKSPAQIAKCKDGQPIRILDMACGSGSFLLGAYQYLLDHCTKWYEANEPEKHSKAVFQDTKGIWRLTISERKRILTTHIFGVDIDHQAVEVTKLSLLLKALEGENDSSLTQQMQLFQERALPNLSNNIKCGNSLIGPDYYENRQANIFDEEELLRVNAFHWQNEFAEVFVQGGFDAVIGNPPYVRQEMLGEYKIYFQSHYLVYHGVADIYAYFIEKGIQLLKQDGRFGYIVANKWLRANYGGPLRRLLQGLCVEELIDFGDLPVFCGATTYPCILRVSKNVAQATFKAVRVDSLNFIDLGEHIKDRRYSVDQKQLDDSAWSLAGKCEQNLLEKLKAKGIPLGTYVDGKIYRGVLTGLNEAFVISKEKKDELISLDPDSAELIKPFLAGRDIKRYEAPATKKYLIFARRGVKIQEYPAIQQHLQMYKDRLMPKPQSFKGEWKGRKPGYYQWYEIQDKVDYWEQFEKPKILVPDISLRGNFAYDADNSFYCVNTAYILPTDDLFLLGVLNSNLLTYIYKQLSAIFRGGYLRFIYQYLIQLPIIRMDENNPIDLLKKNQITFLAQQMLSLYENLTATFNSRIRAQLQQQIDASDKQIDALVYELYGLTQEEIEIVEAAVK